MLSKLLLNVTPQEVRVALLEDKKLTELYCQRQIDRSIVGNIYMGKVSRVLPGMQAAFVDIGLERAAFLYVTDFLDEYSDSFDERDVADHKRRNRKQPKIQDLVKEGQEIMVQIAKDPIGTKGARVTSHISLPGRHLVYMPTVTHTGVSRKIEDEDERKRLRAIVMDTQTLDGGYIIRTAAGDQPANNIIFFFFLLESQWKKILLARKTVKAPYLMHEDLSLMLRSVRDFFTDDIDELIVDSKDAHREIKQYATRYLPKKSRKITLYDDRELLFDQYNIENQIERALGKRIWLKSGGYLIVDQAEALTAIDVNTGRFVGSKSLEETILQTNLEAAKEIVAQIRLRNIGGLIILDFIDMEKRSNRSKIFKALEKELEADKAKTNVLKISDLGLIEMTRKRTRENLSQQLCQPCGYCGGKGFHRSPRTTSNEILRQLQKIDTQQSHHNIEIVAHSSVAAIIKNEEMSSLNQFERETGRRVMVRENPDYHPEKYQINLTGQGSSTAVFKSAHFSDEEEE